MKHVNGSVVFPERLLEEIQQYVQGECVYIPQREGRRMAWGERSGQRAQLARRNQAMREQFRRGASIEQLALGYHLSHDRIKKIVYSTKP